MFFDDSKARARAWLCLAALSRGPCRRDRLVSCARPLSNDRRRRLPPSARHLGLSLCSAAGWFWLCRERDDSAAANGSPDAWPSVVAIIPARDEADMIARSVGSLLRQDYPGRFSVVAGRRPEHGRHGGRRVGRGERSRRRGRLRIVAGNRPAAGLDRQALRRCARAWPNSRLRRAGARICPVHRRRHRLCAACALASASRSPQANSLRADVADGQAALRERGRALRSPRPSCSSSRCSIPSPG